MVKVGNWNIATNMHIVLIQQNCYAIVIIYRDCNKKNIVVEFARYKVERCFLPLSFTMHGVFLFPIHPHPPCPPKKGKLKEKQNGNRESELKARKEKNMLKAQK